MMGITIEFKDGSEEHIMNVESLTRDKDGSITLTRYVRGIEGTGDQDRIEREFDHGVITYISTEDY